MCVCMRACMCVCGNCACVCKVCKFVPMYAVQELLFVGLCVCVCVCARMNEVVMCGTGWYGLTSLAPRQGTMVCCVQAQGNL